MRQAASGAVGAPVRVAITNAGGRLLGVVVNNVNIGQDESYYYYHDHYDRYLHPQDPGKATPATPAPPTKPAAGDEIELQGKY